nr:ACP phosphodiesterase [uncultured Flavobacterium sp.]
MNFLAHIYLSGNDTELQIGNFIADGIRGKDYLNFPERVSQGIMLHRNIDTFTDQHPIFKQTKKYFQPEYGLYSGIIVDMVYDHFLAKNWNDFHDQKLELFVDKFYNTLDFNYTILPQKTQLLLPIMKSENWLVSYKELEGLRNILSKMDNRMKNKSNMQNAIKDLTLNYKNIEQEFNLFFVHLIAYTEKKIIDLEK